MTAGIEIDDLILPPNYTIRHITTADASDATELVRQVDVAACGETTTTLAELESDIKISNEHGPGSFGIFHNHQLVQFLNIHDNLADNGGCFLDLFIHPDYAHAEMIQIADTLLKKVEEFAVKSLRELKKDEDFLKTSLYENDRAFINALANNDYKEHRKYWRLRIDHLEGSTHLKPSVEIRDFENTEEALKTMHELSNIIFADHYDFNPMNFERWKFEFTKGVNNPALWRVAFVDGQPVGYSWGSERFSAESFGYVASLGVLREFRSRGIAKALLFDAFKRDADLGLAGTLLHCDASNPTGATRLYESAGMRIDRVYVAYRKQISID
jgi:mycothiol synthase